ncbi:MAG: ribonuclease D [Gemmataceae bacterium]
MTERILETPSDLAEFVARLSAHSQFGFDTEFIGEETYTPQLCLVQVATPDELVLIDPFTVGPLDGFWAVLADPHYTVVAHAAREEIRICYKSFGKPPGRLVDLQIAAGLAGYGYALSHGALTQQILGVRLNKGETLTDWKKRPLTPRQVQYAFDDVRYLLPLWDKLSGKLAALGRTEWADEEFTTLMRRSLGEEPGIERWRKLGGIAGWDRKRLGMIRALYLWRDAKAARQNRPVRTVVRDDLLVEIVRRNPKTEHDLDVLRGLQKREIPEVMAVLHDARALPAEDTPEARPHEVDPPQLALLTGLLGAVLGNLCGRVGLAQNLVCSNNDLRLLVKSVLRSEPLPENLSLAAGWRAAAILPELLALLRGEVRVRVADAASATPFEIA